MNDAIIDAVKQEHPTAGWTTSCNALIESGDNVYMELNPSLNLWRYSTSVNSDSKSRYLGCNLSNEVQYKEVNGRGNDGKQYIVKYPEFFIIRYVNSYLLQDYYHPQVLLTDWVPAADGAESYIAVDGETNCLIFDSAGELAAIVENGESFVLSDGGYYCGYSGNTEDGTYGGGKLYLPLDTYTVSYNSGTIQFYGCSNVIGISGSADMRVTVNLAANEVHATAKADGELSVKCANVFSKDACSYAETSGNLGEGETLTLAFSDDNSITTKVDGDASFDLYTKEEDEEAPKYTQTASSNPFMDVAEGRFYYKPVLWAVENNITSGMDATYFMPERSCTRGQVVTFLWRAMGCPEPESDSCPFVDVNSNRFYYKPILWAYENGITAGIDATHFAPEATVTRGQFVTFLWRAEGKPSSSGSNPFSDVGNGRFYDRAILWAAENGITSGMTATTFESERTCTRGQVVTFLYRDLGK